MRVADLMCVHGAIKNVGDETIGEIKSIDGNKDVRVDSLMVGVGSQVERAAVRPQVGRLIRKQERAPVRRPFCIQLAMKGLALAS